MDLKKLDHNIKSFASELNSEIHEKDLGFVGGKIRTYSFNESETIHYVLKHSMPESEIGSKFQIESDTKIYGIQISVSKNLFGRIRTKFRGYISPELKKNQIESLSKNIFEFKWSTEFIDQEQFQLKFKTKDIEMDIETMRLIRKLHIQLLK